MSVLNALNTPMVARLQRLNESWEENSNIGFVLTNVPFNGCCEKAISSGSDVISLYNWIEEGNTEDCEDFFDMLYKFVYLQATYLKPPVAILDGITIGSGAGISLPGMFRLTTDKTVLAHPEVQIGFHPDVGASFFLSRLPGYLGEYLALTGDKLNGVEMIAFGLATHYSLNARLSLMNECLSKLITDDPSVTETSLAQYGYIVFPDRSSILHRFQSIDQCLAPEFQISLHAACGSVSKNFCEGVRARLVDKDFAPKWDPPSLAEVTEEMVDRCFLRAEETEPVLELPTATQEPFVR